jgi:hypothetical protein
MTTNVLFGGLPINVAISVPPMNTGLTPGSSGGSGSGGSSGSSSGNNPGGGTGGACICPLTPGNGIGSIYQGQNPVAVVALAPLPAFVAVVMSSGGVVLADTTNPAHRDIVWGINVTSVGTGQIASVIWGGPVVNNINGTGGWNFVTNQPVYIGANGALTQMPPTTGWALPVGFALSMNTLNLFPARSVAPSASLNAPRVSVLAFSPNTQLDFNAAEVFDLVLASNTILSMNNGVDGRTIVLRVRQDATGGRAMTLDTDIVAGASYLSIPGAPGSQARYVFQYDGATGLYICLSATTF